MQSSRSPLMVRDAHALSPSAFSSHRQLHIASESSDPASPIDFDDLQSPVSRMRGLQPGRRSARKVKTEAELMEEMETQPRSPRSILALSGVLQPNTPQPPPPAETSAPATPPATLQPPEEDKAAMVKVSQLATARRCILVVVSLII